jgi:hypothetical protein
MKMFQPLNDEKMPISRPCTSPDVASLIAYLEDETENLVTVETKERNKKPLWLRVVELDAATNGG